MRDRIYFRCVDEKEASIPNMMRKNGLKNKLGNRSMGDLIDCLRRSNFHSRGESGSIVREKIRRNLDKSSKLRLEVLPRKLYIAGICSANPT